MITRRTLIRNAAASSAALMLPQTVWANAAMTIGTMQIDTLSDGQLTLPPAMTFGDLPATELAPILQQYGIAPDQTLTPDCNVTLVRDGERTILFDVGAGPDFMSSAGKLAEAFDALGVSADEITHVVFTHAHPDHLWGLLDDFDDPVFPNATYLIGKAEWDYWINPNTVDTIDTGRTTFAVGAKRRLETLEDNITFFNDGEEIFPNIAARGTFGHTPGHMAFQLGAGTDSVMILGDCIGNHHVAFARPDWASGSDQDADLGIKTRTMLLDQLAAEQMHLIGFHLPYPGIGRAEKQGDNYVFVPA
ncbi:MAG: MBL fold metallo-hydrolase [Yoonia sp.]|nr:MBL fold metallo-hydrolase [Yoonia sp.]